VEWSPPTFTSSYDFGFCPAQAINSLSHVRAWAGIKKLATPQSNRSISIVPPSISLLFLGHKTRAPLPACCYTARSLHITSLSISDAHGMHVCAACRDSLLHASSHARACMHIGYGPVREGMRSIRPCDARAYSSATCQHGSNEKLAPSTTLSHTS
jgi:hypothetical protein